MVELRIRLEKVDARKLIPEENADTELTYKVNVTLSEVERNPGAVTLAFVIDVASEPQVAQIALSGTATMIGTKQETQQLLTGSDSKAPPPILAKIYERLYGTLYVLCDALQVAHPLPTLVRE